MEQSVNLVPVFLAEGLPEPVLEHRFHEERQWRFDYAWPEARVAFEREGGTWGSSRHTSGEGYRNDCEKYSEAALAGWVVIRATADMLRDGSALALLRRTLLARGVVKTGG